MTSYRSFRVAQATPRVTSRPMATCFPACSFFAQRQCAPAEIHGYLAPFRPAQRGALHHRARSTGLLDMQSCWYVHALSRTGLPRQVRESKHEATKAVIAKRVADRQKNRTRCEAHRLESNVRGLVLKRQMTFPDSQRVAPATEPRSIFSYSGNVIFQGDLSGQRQFSLYCPSERFVFSNPFAWRSAPNTSSEVLQIR